MGKPKNRDEESMGVVENKNVPGNGLTDVVAPEEGEPLRKKEKESSGGGKLKGALKKGKNNKKEEIKMSETPPDVKISDLDMDPEDPGPSVSDNESDNTSGGGRNRRRQNKKDFLGNCATKCHLTPKKGLIYILFCAVVIFILFFILILLAALWPKGPDMEACQTSQCHLYSSQILQGLNSTSEPCEDYWEFSCGGWLHVNPLPKSKANWDVEALEEFRVKEKLRGLLNTLPMAVSEESNSVPFKMKRFYDSCMGSEYIQADGEKPLLRVIKALGGWNVLRDFRASDFDFPRVLRKLQGDYRINPFFRVGVVPDPRTPSRNIIKITPSGLSLPHKSYYSIEHGEQGDPMASAFQTYAKDVVQLLGATSYQGSLFATEIFNFEKRIAEATPEPIELEDPVTNFNKVTVAELKAMSNTIFWGDLLKALFPQGNVNDQTEVLTPSVQYLKDISSVISTTDKGNLNNYLIWHLTQQYLPYLSRPFTEAYEMFRKESIGSSEATQRWEFCTTEVIKFFPHGCDYLLAQSSDPQRETRIETIEEMFEAMRQTLSNRVDSGIKFDESMKHFLLDKLRLMTITVGTPIQNKTFLKELYSSLDQQKNEFFTNIISLTEFRNRVEQKDLVNPNKETPILNTFAESPFKIQFLPSINKVVVPESVLQRDVLNVKKSHLPLVFGSVGVEIAQAMATAFGPEQGLYFSNGALLSERDAKAQELRDIIESRRTCLKSFFTNIRLDDEPYINNTALDTTLHLAGIQVALETLRTHDASDSFQGLPGFDDYSTDALFFLAYGQSQCSVHTMLFHDLEHRTFKSLDHEHRLKGVLRQLVGFSEAFQCSKSSEMYADFTCGSVI